MGKDQHNFYSHVEEVAKNKSWIHPRLFSVPHSTLQKQNLPAGQLRARLPASSHKAVVWSP